LRAAKADERMDAIQKLFSVAAVKLASGGLDVSDTKSLYFFGSEVIFESR